MEESEKRKERLKAMRVEAAQAGANNNDAVNPAIGSQCLANPLIETRTTTAQPAAPAARFDYYTNPMSAFSANKRSSNMSPHVSQGFYSNSPRPRTPDMTPPPAYTTHTMNFPSPRMFQAPGPRTLDMSASTAYQNHTVNSPSQRAFQPRGAYHNYSPLGSPLETTNPLVSPHGNFPSNQMNPDGDYFSSPNPLRGNFARPGQGYTGNYNHGQGRGHWFSTSSPCGLGRGGSPYHPHSQKGWSHSSGNSSFSPGLGHSGRRGAGGSRDPPSAESRPDLYYSKSMIEDPWKHLTPVILKREDKQGKSFDTPENSKSWLPKSITAKRPRASSETSHKRGQQSSLAEYLAASFNEAINEAVDDQHET